MQETPKLDIFQEALFYTLASNKNSVLDTVAIAVEQYL